MYLLTLILLQQFGFYPSYSLLRQTVHTSYPPSSSLLSAFKRGLYHVSTKPAFGGIDGRSIKDGSLIEYLSAKGSKRLALVNKRKGPTLLVLNNDMMEFSVSVSKVSLVIEGYYAVNDLKRLIDLIDNVELCQVQKLWDYSVENDIPSFSHSSVSEEIFGSQDAICMYASRKLMTQFGGVYFNSTPPTEPNSGKSAYLLNEYAPLSRNHIEANLRHQRALQRFRSEFTRVMTSQSSHSSAVNPTVPMKPEVLSVLSDYTEGLKQMMARVHPWVVNAWCVNNFDGDATVKGAELLDYLELSPSSRNARKVLELTGIWPLHTNVEKYVADIRDEFPAIVLEEAENLLQNMDSPDLDEAVRKDLTQFRCFAIDSEGADEVDDAVSLEILPDGREKIWTHISDVSRWIRPDSQLMLEAERRMTSMYMPDEVIGMFPSCLTQGLLSLGAEDISYAFSCGTILNDKGEIESFEVCPSKIRLTHRITYDQLDEVLAHSESFSPSSSLGQIPLTSANEDLLRLARWARLRSAFRRDERGALDSYLMHKTELSLKVKLAGKNNYHGETAISSILKYGNSPGNSFVAEFMILMSEVVGQYSSELGAQTRFKIQAPPVSLLPADLLLGDEETPFMRSNRIIKHLKAATDSMTAGLHCTSGSSTYMQCTSPIRRYHDLHNHFVLKNVMRTAGKSPQPTDAAGATEVLPTVAAADTEIEGSAGAVVTECTSLEAKQQTLNSVKLVSRSRGQYWLLQLLKEIAATEPRRVFSCTVVGPGSGGGAKGDSDQEAVVKKTTDIRFVDAMVTELGSFQPYKLYCPFDSTPAIGVEMKCHLHKYTDKNSLGDFICVPVEIDYRDLVRNDIPTPRPTKDSIINNNNGQNSDDSRGSG